ncbi:MAG: hypothetical protein HY260_19120 [Chloroflexi bacterium]|nr:hypothetical protein [Chloroflexota bacterium]
MERLQQKYTCPNGDEWEVWFVVYDTDKYAPGGRDEVLQYKKNGSEVGHHTRHLDKDGGLLDENYHGMTTLPEDAKPV